MKEVKELSNRAKVTMKEIKINNIRVLKGQRGGQWERTNGEARRKPDKDEERRLSAEEGYIDIFQ